MVTNFFKLRMCIYKNRTIERSYLRFHQRIYHEEQGKLYKAASENV